ncbi:8-amino-7-oxononanoate synthase [Bradyrhizobium canariense]|uniref:8-amino-7-oxononanoate synthase n=1 Tax=Bradyrhizobium canariense TaxID=255045 RepID=A0ABX3XB47_9BRAD|nr:8-amino-7-oxononanoate synthase [Bradyrhizobium canariense]OSJ19767.1 8-amino-7-oxononanoate synthase [Bradyrhizobium canariense]OSJ35923.1 8-amino-7-oxononanoate synthase [Bradyrhizobium canariense]
MSLRMWRYESKLQQLAREGRQRFLSTNSGLDFTSNDYLGLASSPRMSAAVAAALERAVPVGAGGSRLLRGNHYEHEALEEEAAAFFGSERMLYFCSGFVANLAVLSTLPQGGDLVVHDALVHASAYEGMRSGRGTFVSAPHNDADAVDSAIRAWREEGGMGVPWIVVESLYSMDGDRAPLRDLMQIANRYDGFLYIDEAHATGVHGEDGRGYAKAYEGGENVIILHTCGKALGVAGALVGASRPIQEFLVNRARSFIYATAPPPLQAASVREALTILRAEPERRSKLLKLVKFANEQLAKHLGLVGTGTQVIPVIVGDSDRAVRIAEQMQADGFDLRAIRPPTVPEGTARLRVTITLNNEGDAVAQMFERLAEVVRQTL